MNETKLQAATAAIPDAKTVAAKALKTALENEAAAIVTFVTAALNEHFASDKGLSYVIVDISKCTACNSSVDLALEAFRSKGYDATVLTGQALSIQISWKSQ